jgi:hypothetical protein
MKLQEEKTLRFLKNISTELQKHSYNDLKPWLIDYVKYLPIPNITTSSFPRTAKSGTYKAPNEIYRCCANEIVIEKKTTFLLPFKPVERISIIPEHLENKVPAGRANEPGIGRFYCSSDYMTASIECLTKGFEIDKSADTTVTMGTWHVKEPLLIVPVYLSKNRLKAFREYDPDFFDNELQQTNDWYENNFQTLLQNDYSASLDYAKEITEFFSDEFAKVDISHPYDYNLSIFYTDFMFNHKLRNDQKPIDAVMYPSAKFLYGNRNMAIHRRAMNKLSFVHASQVWVTYNASNKNTQCSPLETVGADTDGILKWNKFNYD